MGLIKIIGGNAWQLIEEVLFTAAVFTDGTIDKDNWSEVDDGFHGPYASVFTGSTQ